MKAAVISLYVNNYLMHFLVRMVSERKKIYCHCFSTLLRNVGFEIIWNSSNPLSTLIMLIFSGAS